jgi:hypothetical protein
LLDLIAKAMGKPVTIDAAEATEAALYEDEEDDTSDDELLTDIVVELDDGDDGDDDTNGPDWTPIRIVLDGQPGPPLRKRRAMLSMIQNLVARGVQLTEISKLVQPAKLRMVPGETRDPEQLAEALHALGVGKPLARYFLDAPIIQGGNTYVVSKMWGRRTLETMTRLRDAFPTLGVGFQSDAMVDA